jgi:arginyl-tRNA--protein-N-Asp/Glu arginylyltransferase
MVFWATFGKCRGTRLTDFRDPAEHPPAASTGTGALETILHSTEAPSPCHYTADHMCRYEYIYVSRMDSDEYTAYLVQGWRRFGYMLFRQTCSGPGGCRSLRVDAARFRASRSQRRSHAANAENVRLRIGTPAVTPEKIAIFERFQADRSEARGWSPYEPGAAAEFLRSLASNPFPTQEWCYFFHGALVGVGYVDELPVGLSAIYFARDPACRDRSLGTWNVLCLINQARALGLPHVYLGYHVDGCPSLRYKAGFRPNERLDSYGVWRGTSC